MGTLIGYARVSPQALETDHQVRDLAAAGVRPDDLYVDLGACGARTDHSLLERAIGTLREGDTLVSTTLASLGRSTSDLLALTGTLRANGAALRVLDISESTDNSSASGQNTVLAVLTAVAGLELEVARERIRESVFKRRSSSTRRGGRWKTFTERQIRNALRLIESGEQPSQVARDLGMSRTTLYRRINNIQP
ncbi:recombinase family protein [Cryobacterium zhongshanensis]|uniref:Recombinase family protein n=1 Tax=Cryobacterium zhongshanensis TaxID=2928153 RepID=A0AA41QVY4_9MICO|nr:recombinase family protein [Cryobacterium zhongshanensis]MCI4658454.1 recombinase family protein [Cryobacterium zhongshanensis]